MRITVVLVALIAVAQGQTTWNGNLGTAWNVAGNWTNGVPTVAVNAVIPSGTANAPTTAGVAGATCRNLTVNAGASLTIAPGFPLETEGNVVVPGTLSGGGLLRQTGTILAVISGAGTFAVDLEIAKTAPGRVSVTSSFTLSGNLLFSSGELRVATSSYTVSVLGNATFQGGTLTTVSIGTLDVAGNVTFSGTTVNGSTPNIRCAGNWTADALFAPTSSEVIFDGSGAPQTISATSATFQTLTIEAGANVTLATSILVAQTLTVAGSLAAPPGLVATAQGNVVVPGTLSGGGLLKQTGTALASISGAGTFAVDLEVAKTVPGRVSVTSSITLSGNLLFSSGEFRVATSSQYTLAVLGNATLLGGTLTTGGGTLDVAGNVTCSGTAVTGPSPDIRCAGNWTADLLFAPTSSEVIFDGSGAPQSISATSATFPTLTIEAGANVTLATSILVAQTLTVAGSLAAPPGLVVTAEGNVVVPGTLSGGGLLKYTGTTLALISGAGTFAVDLEVAKTVPGRVSVTSSITLSGNLLLSSGELRVSASSQYTLAVLGNATLLGGTLTTGGGTLDVAGNVTFSGTAVTGPSPDIRCAGNWTADALFAPTGGVVELDGPIPTTIASMTPGGTLGFLTLVLKNATRTVANDFTIAATTITIDPTGVLSVPAGRHLKIQRPAGATAVAVNGGLAVAASGTLSLGPQTTTTVSASGLLTLVGTPGAPATVAGEAGGGYALVVNGGIAARDFVVKEMGTAGMVINVSATIAPAPNDLQRGTFDFRAGAPTGSVLLDLRRNAPAPSFDGFVFHNTPGASGTFNVKTVASGVPIVFSNWSGAFAGPAFENDPNGLVAWSTQAPPTLAYFAVKPGAQLAEVYWGAASEIGVTSYEIRRASAASGPFAVIATLGAGAPSYGFIDAPLTANLPKSYLVHAVMSQGDRLLLGSGTVTPYSSATPANINKVGGNGTFATIQAAIDAATNVNSVVWVTPGTYAAFAIGALAPANLRIFGDGTGPVQIDTSGGPITISNVPATSGIELSNLSVGNAATLQNGITISNCAGPVVLDEVDVACDAAHVAITVTASPQLAIQRSQVAGGTGLLVSSGSYVAISRGSLSSLVSTGSTIEISTLTPGSVNVAPPGSLVTRTTLMPEIDLPEFIRLSLPSVMTLTADPNALFVVMASTRLGFMSGNFEMPFLLDPASMAGLPTMFTDQTGQATVAFEVEPDAALLGFSFVVQVVVGDPVTFASKLSNVETMVGIP